MPRTMRPEWRYGLTAFALCAVLTVTLILALRMPGTWIVWLASWLVVVNLVTFSYYGYDKRQAIFAGHRVPELVLHVLAAVGGTGGAYAGMRFFRHKTIKGSFRLFFASVAVLQAVLLVTVLICVLRG